MKRANYPGIWYYTQGSLYTHAHGLHILGKPFSLVAVSLLLVSVTKLSGVSVKLSAKAQMRNLGTAITVL